MSPAFNRYGCTLIGKVSDCPCKHTTKLYGISNTVFERCFFQNNVVLAEWKPPVYDNDGGIVLVTATTRRNSPNV